MEQLLGSGGMGHVYRATNELIGRQVAIKVLRAEYAQNVEVVERFLREARAANLVRHVNVVDVLDIGQDNDGTPFIVQELLVGEDLAHYAHRCGGSIALIELGTLLCPVIDAIAEAHAKGVLHRDIKPENVFLAREGNARVPKLLDFGISHISSQNNRMTVDGTAMGTPAYMPPEQIRGARDIDARADIWSIGGMIFEMVAGRLPFEGDDAPALFVAIATTRAPLLRDVVLSVPEDLSRIVDRCLRRDRDERYASAADVARDLRLVMRGASLSPDDALIPVLESIPALLVPDLEDAPRQRSVPPPSVRGGDPIAPMPELMVLAESVPQSAMMSGLMLDGGPSRRPPRPVAASYHAHHQPTSQGEETSMIALAAVSGITVLALAALTVYARAPDGVRVFQLLGMQSSADVTKATQVGLSALAAILGGVFMRGAYRTWIAPHGGGSVAATFMSLLASGAFFVALELARGAF